MTSQRNQEPGFMNQKKKNDPIENEYPTIGNAGSALIRQWKKGTTVIAGDSMLARNEEKRISGNRKVKLRIFPSLTTQDKYDYLKPLLKKESRQHYLACWNQ